RQLPGVEDVAVSNVVPWTNDAYGGVQFSADGHVPAAAEEHPEAIFRIVSPGFFATVGLPIIEGRDFTDADRQGGKPVAVISQSVARRMFPKRDALNHHVMWTDPIL